MSGISCPDQNTINRFRSEKLKGVLEKIYAQIVLLLVKGGQLRIEEIFTDRTKIESNAIKYTFVWSKSVMRNKKRIIEQIKEIWQYTQKISEIEKLDMEEEIEKMDPKKLKKSIKKMDKIFEGKEVDKKIK